MEVTGLRHEGEVRHGGDRSEVSHGGDKCE